MDKSSDDIRPTSKLLPDETFSKWNSVHCVLLHDGVSRKALVNKTAEVRFGKGSLMSEGRKLKKHARLFLDKIFG